MDAETVRRRASLNANTATALGVEVVEGAGVFDFGLIEGDLKRDAAMVHRANLSANWQN